MAGMNELTRSRARLVDRGVHSSEAMMLSLCFRFPSVSEKFFGLRRKSFFSHRPQILNFPLFSLFQYISPYFAKFLFSPTFPNSPDFVKFTCLLHTLCVFRFPLLQARSQDFNHSDCHISGFMYFR